MATYKPPEYDEKKYSKGVDTSFYNNAIKDYTAQANKERNLQLGQAQQTQQANLRSAYVNRLQNEQQLNNNLAAAGIRGGATETSNLRLANQYGQARAAANTDYTNSVNSINQAFDKNISDYTSDMRSRAQEYRQNTAMANWQAARENYANAWQAKREDADKKYERAWAKNQRKYERAVAKDQRIYDRKQAETQRQTEYWSNYYINKYSGYSKKDLKKAEKDIKAKLKKAKTPAEKIRWQQALAGIGGRRGVIATSK